MTSRIELALSKTAELRGGSIVFGPANRRNVPPGSWIRFAQDATLPLEWFAGIHGPLSGLNEVFELVDPVEEWAGLARTLNRLLGAFLRDCPQKLVEMASEDRRRVFERLGVASVWEPFPKLISSVLAAGEICVGSVDPVLFEGVTPKGKVLAAAINQMLEARHALLCNNCGMLFLLNTQRPSAFCGSACRKADHLRKHEAA